MPTTHQQRLAQRVVNNRKDRARALANSKWLQDRLRAIREAPRHTTMDFWCATCEQDFSCTNAIKLVRTTPSTQIPRAWYEANCPAGHHAIRHVTDKHLDPYYHLSANLRLERRRMRDDLLTPSDPRFRVVYPRQWAQMEAEREAREQAEQAENEQLYG